MTLVRLNQLNSKMFAHNRYWVMLLLACWLLLSTSSFVHAQQHIANDNVQHEQGIVSKTQCSLCLNSFLHTPFIATQSLAFEASVLVYDAINTELFVAKKQRTYNNSNRDPPTFSFYF